MALRVAGKAPLCGQLKCMTAMQHWQAVKTLSVIREPIRALNADADLTLWEVDGRSWWCPPLGRDFLRKMQDEMSMDVYGLGRLPEGAVVIDGGANVGMFARAALDAGAERVICFEPSPLTREALIRNLPKDRIVVREEALWNEAGTALFALPSDDAGSSQIVQSDGVSGTENGIQAVLATIDTVVAELGLSRVDFIKLDIEGAETQAILGAAGTLARFRPRIAIATEHTTDVLANNRSVLDALQKIAPFFDVRCMECHAEKSASFGGIALAPYVLQAG